MTWQQQGPCGTFAKARGEQCRAAHGISHNALQLLRFKHKQLGAGQAAFTGRDAHYNAVIAGHHRGVDSQALTYPLGDGQRPRAVYTLAVRGVQNHSPVPGFIQTALNDQRPISWQCAGGLTLLGDQCEQVVDRVGVQADAFETLLSLLAGCFAGPLNVQFAQEGTNGFAQLGRAAQAIAAPKRQARRAAGGGCHDHLITGDLLDTPG